MAKVERFDGGIGPANLIELVRSTAPFLFAAPLTSPAGARLSELAAGPLGWLAIIHAAGRLPATDHPSGEQREDYFALCLSCHHATVATFVPTDVDSKIRGHAWSRGGIAVARRLFAVAEQALAWDSAGISARWVASPAGAVGGHHGELLGVLAGALGAFIRSADAEHAELAAAAIDGELARQAAAFRQTLATDGRELDALRLAAILTHNVGDLDQGIGYWPGGAAEAGHRARFHRLAHENTAPHGGVFQLAARLYKQLLAAEGHRHYPLRAVKGLRRSAAFLLPLGPFFDAWGATIGSHPELARGERIEVLEALLTGCRKIPNQIGYHRAIAGIATALGGSLEPLLRRLPESTAMIANDVEVRRHRALGREDFENGLRQRARALLDNGGPPGAV